MDENRNKKNLIDCYSDLLKTVFKSDNGIVVEYNMDSVVIAYHRTIEELKILENNTQNINSSNCGMVLNMWFISIEKYINTILRLVAKHKNMTEDNIEKQIKKDLTDRVQFILDKIGHDRQKFYKGSTTFQLLRDFCTFRNEYLHNRDRKQTYQKAVFSTRSSEPICSDLIQGMLVFINITMCFRHIFHTIDFMPSVPFSNKVGGVKFEHIDIV